MTVPTPAVIAPTVNTFRARGLVSSDDSSATGNPAPRPTAAVRVWVSRRTAIAGTETNNATLPGVSLLNHRISTSPVSTAAYWPTCGAVNGQIAPTSRPS